MNLGNIQEGGKLQVQTSNSYRRFNFKFHVVSGPKKITLNYDSMEAGVMNTQRFAVSLPRHETKAVDQASATPHMHPFFQCSQFAVLGASTSPLKFGNRVFKWYLSHSLRVTPINPKAESVLNIPTFNTLNAFLDTVPSGERVGISVVTPPSVSLDLFKEVMGKGESDGNANKVGGVWFQPGSYDSKVLKYVRETMGVDIVISHGDCILVSGESKMRS